MKNEKAALLDIHAKISLDRTKNLRHVRGQLRALEMGLKNRHIYVFIVAGGKPRVLILHVKTSKRFFQSSLA